jgi:hypothetical protein
MAAPEGTANQQPDTHDLEIPASIFLHFLRLMLIETSPASC